LATKIIKLKYLSADRFIEDYSRLCTGNLFIPTNSRLPLQTRLRLHISVTDLEKVLSIECEVSKIIDHQAGSQVEKSGGMIVKLIERPETALNEIKSALRANTYYRRRLDLGDPAETNKTELACTATAAEPSNDDALAMTWLHTALAQKTVVREKESVARFGAAPANEKKQLSSDDQKKARPSGEFLIELTKAMLRSGNYAADHPRRDQACQDLYDAFKRCVQDTSELMLAVRRSADQSNILVTGILYEPVAVLILVGSSMAQLFLTSLESYFKSSRLVGFAIQKEISLENFVLFLDIISDPVADTPDNAAIGRTMSRKLAEQGIVEVSTVFKHELIALGPDIPWPVEMAMHRLTKDLKLRQLSRTSSEADAQKMSLPVIGHHLRPLNHPDLQKDLITNRRFIGRAAKDLAIEDIEETIIDSVPLNLLLPTARLFFEELNRLRRMHADNPDDVSLKSRFGSTKRILRQMGLRLVREGVKGDQRFLEDLYINGILSFGEMPPDVQYLVNTEKMVQNARSHIDIYVRRILNVGNAEDAAVLNQFFLRILPVLISRADWKITARMAAAWAEAAGKSDVFKNTPGLPANPLLAAFKDRTDKMVAGYEKANDAQRETIEAITGLLGIQGIEILSRVLSESEDRGARKEAMAALIRKGGLARNWIFKVLDDPKQKWFQKRNALMLLGKIGKYKQDMEYARRFLHHEQPKVRAEALNALISLQAADADKAVITALEDPDQQVRWRAMNGLADLSVVSEASIGKLLDWIAVEPPEDKEAADNFYDKTVRLIRAIGGFRKIPNRAEAEDAILGIARKFSKQNKGLFKRIAGTSTPEQSNVLTAAIIALGKIGSEQSEAFLAKLARGKTPQAEHAQQAANRIRLRDMA